MEDWDRISGQLYCTKPFSNEYTLVSNKNKYNYHFLLSSDQ